MSWSDRFIGIPFSEFGRSRTGCDCWGLVCVIYREELGLRLLEYVGDYSSAEERGEISALISDGAASPLWLPVTGPAIAFDVAVFRRGRLSSHVGVVIRHGVMIHLQGEDCAKVEDYQRGPWRWRFQGHYRYAAQAVERPVQIVSEAGR